MKILNKLAIAATLSAPLIAGCNTKSSNNDELMPMGNYIAKRTVSKPLTELKDVMAGVTVFDRNNDNILSRQEVEEYIRTVIVKRKEGNLSQEEINIIQQLEQNTAAATELGIVLWDRSAKLVLPGNIAKTLDNFLAVREIYQERLWEEQDKGIKEQRDKMFPLPHDQENF